MGQEVFITRATFINRTKGLLKFMAPGFYGMVAFVVLWTSTYTKSLQNPPCGPCTSAAAEMRQEAVCIEAGASLS